MLRGILIIIPAFALLAAGTVSDTHTDGINWTEQSVATNLSFEPSMCLASDLDSDGDCDFVVTSEQGIIQWWENINFQSYASHIISQDMISPYIFHIIDIENDNDLDILVSSTGTPDISLFINDGHQVFSKYTISNEVTACGTWPVDIDGDSDIDIIAGSHKITGIYWFENVNGTSFLKNTISTGSNKHEYVYGIDVDLDGDIDIVSSSTYGDVIIWWENDGNQVFTPQQIDNSANMVIDVNAIDLDFDGDIDVLSGSNDGGDGIRWYENDGNQSFTEHIIHSSGNRRLFKENIVDIDLDGDLDVLATDFWNGRIELWENDGNQAFSLETLVDKPDHCPGLHTADIDFDGDLDFLSIFVRANYLSWWESDLSSGNHDLTLSLFPDPLNAGGPAIFTVSDSEKFTYTFLAYSTVGLGSKYIPPLNVTLGILAPKPAGEVKMTDMIGMATWVMTVPNTFLGYDVWFQAFQYGKISNVVDTSVK